MASVSIKAEKRSGMVKKRKNTKTIKRCRISSGRSGLRSVSAHAGSFALLTEQEVPVRVERRD